MIRTNLRWRNVQRLNVQSSLRYLLFSKLRSLVSCRGKKVVILLQKLELELVTSDCNDIQQLDEMNETRTRCVAISCGGKMCYSISCNDRSVKDEICGRGLFC